MLWLKCIYKRTLQLVPKDLCHVFVAFQGGTSLFLTEGHFMSLEFTVSTDFSLASPGS